MDSRGDTTVRASSRAARPGAPALRADAPGRPQVAEGYLDNLRPLRSPSAKGWLHKGDLGFIDADCYLLLVDRKKEMVICSGYNIFPREVDEVLVTHSAVQEAASVGVADPYRGETLKAFVILKPGAKVSPEELSAHCRERLAVYEIPHSFDICNSFPKNAIGKILKQELRLIAEASSDIRKSISS